MSTTYPSDLSDAEWACVQRHLPSLSTRGGPLTHDLHRILDAMFYTCAPAAPGRYLPSQFPPGQPVYWCFRKWRLNGTWAQLHAGRDPTPSAAIIDSQSVKTLTGRGRGFDGGKKLARRKRLTLVDTQGFCLPSCFMPRIFPTGKEGNASLRRWAAPSTG